MLQSDLNLFIIYDIDMLLDNCDSVQQSTLVAMALSIEELKCLLTESLLYCLDDPCNARSLQFGNLP